MSDSVASTYSISVRLRRVTTESAHMSVPVTGGLMIPRPDGTGRIDLDGMVRRAIESASTPGFTRHIEERQVEPNPIQTPSPGIAESREG